MTVEQMAMVRKATRELWELIVRSWILDIVFLFAAFSAWPSYKWPIGLGFATLKASIGLGISQAQILAVQRNIVDDAAERKTRHTIKYAAERAGQYTDDWEFWAEVNRRVEAEQPSGAEGGGLWGQAFRVAGAVLMNIVLALIWIGIVAALTDSY